MIKVSNIMLDGQLVHAKHQYVGSLDWKAWTITEADKACSAQKACHGVLLDETRGTPYVALVESFVSVYEISGVSTFIKPSCRLPLCQWFAAREKSDGGT